ncbi:hypothetical protein EJ110_NYTH55062 [Nymphaea thermarum]|nr:hypothetical protein EJ110_NYTH55062 [Nymphaea thermarum]
MASFRWLLQLDVDSDSPSTVTGRNGYLRAVTTVTANQGAQLVMVECNRAPREAAKHEPISCHEFPM